MKKQPLPIGVDIFENLRVQNAYYVDKTGLIPALIGMNAQVTLFTRPRRFGKTLNMTMLKAFFELGTDPALFDGLVVAQDAALCASHMGRYPVIFLTFKAMDALAFPDAREMLLLKIQGEIRRHGYLLDSEHLPKNDKARLNRIETGDVSLAEIQTSVAYLCEMLYQHHKQKVILLIDEYDVPLDKSFQRGHYQEMVTLVRNMFDAALKSNPYLRLAVLTGCLRISKESIFTGINNLWVNTILDEDFDECFGFTGEEVRRMLAHCGAEARYGELQAWYDGYHFGRADVYCPWSVVNCCNLLMRYPAAEPEAYWLNTSSNDLVRRFVDKADKSTREDLERLVNGEAVEKVVNVNLTYSELDKDMENLWSVLFMTGYLTLGRTAKGGARAPVWLTIPNEEVRLAFIDSIQKWFAEKAKDAAQSNRLDGLFRALGQGDAAQVSVELTTQLRQTVSYFDAQESYYHGFLAGLLKACPTWSVRSNRETGDGRSDLVMEQEDGALGAVIEIKQVKAREELEGACDRALEQAKTKRYADALMENGVEVVWVYGVAFWRKSCVVKAERAAAQAW